MVLKVRTSSGDCLVIGNIATCWVAQAVLANKANRAGRRWWYWRQDRGKLPQYPDRSYVPSEWYDAGKGQPAHEAQMAAMYRTDGSTFIVVFSEDATLLNADGRVVMRY